MGNDLAIINYFGEYILVSDELAEAIENAMKGN